MAPPNRRAAMPACPSPPVASKLDGPASGPYPMTPAVTERLMSPHPAHRRAQHTFNCPAQVDGGGPGSQQKISSHTEIPAFTLGLEHAVGGSRANQPRSAHVHIRNGSGGVFQRGQVLNNKLVRQLPLINNL